jgi:hypothetical protein
MERTSVYRFAVAVTGLLMFGVAIATFASAQTDDVRVTTYRFGTLGLTRGFTARLVVMNTSFPPNPCRVELRLLPADPVQPPDPAVPPDLVRPGEQVIAELIGNDIIPSDAPRGTRVEVAALANISTPPDPIFPPQPCVTSFQIVNSFTGITTAVGTLQVFPSQ